MTPFGIRLLLLAGQLVCVAALLAGCRATFVEPARAPSAVHSRWTHFFFLGAVGHANVDARDLCPSGRVRSVETYGNVGTTLLSVLTIGVYTPRKVEVTCEAG